EGDRRRRSLALRRRTGATDREDADVELGRVEPHGVTAGEVHERSAHVAHDLLESSVEHRRLQRVEVLVDRAARLRQEAHVPRDRDDPVAHARWLLTETTSPVMYDE